MIDAIWDNGGKGGKNESRYTFLKGCRLYVCRADGSWEFVTNEQRIKENAISSLGIPDRKWMDKNMKRVDFKDLPIMIQEAIKQAVYA